MAEYIEREAVLKIIGDNCPPDKCGYNTEEEMGAGAACYYIMKDVEKIPTADVAPKSEVEKQKLEIWRLQGQVNRLKKYDEERDIALHARLIAKAKAEVAMEIFADIAKYERKPIPESKPVYVLKQSDFDELKKKYTGYKV